MSRKLKFDSDAMSDLYAGVDELAKAVKVTLGPKGRNVLLHRAYGSPHVTKDGISVAKEVDSSDPIRKMAMDLVREGANDTVEKAGDGTTSTTVLTHAVLKYGIQALNLRKRTMLSRALNSIGIKSVNAKNGSNAMDVKRGIDIASDLIIRELSNLKTPVKSSQDIYNVSRISSNNDQEIGLLIKTAIELVGNDGVIQSDDSPTSDSSVSLVEGIKLDRGFVSSEFATDEGRLNAIYDNPYYFLYNGRLDSIQDLLRAVELVMAIEKPLVIIADDYDTNVLNFLLRNRVQAELKVVALKAPGMGDQKFQLLRDLAALTGCSTLDPNVSENLSQITLGHLGTSKSIKVNKGTTVIVADDSHKETVKFRVDDLKSEIAVCELASMKEKLQNRVAQLEGKLAMIYIGANSEVELKEKKDRLDDALEATRAAIEEGIVPGAGMTLLRISERHLGKKHHDNKDINAGVLSVMYAIRTLAHAILDNAGLDSKNIIATLIAEYGLNDGFNPISEKYVNLITEGIIDPVKVTRLAVKNACSIAGMIITTGCIVYKPNENE